MKSLALIFVCLLQPLIVHAENFTLRETAGFPNTLEARDFFVLQRTEAPLLRNSADDCRSHIKDVICWVEPAQKDQDVMTRPCLDGGEKYAAVFEKLYDNDPPALQKMFCSLRRIFIEKSFEGTAYAGLIKGKDGKPNGAMIGIRASVLDEKLNLSTWASWKEQLSFGGPTDVYQPREDLPVIKASSRSEASDFLYFVIAHEFGHLFDFANDLNKTGKCTKGPGEEEICEMAPDGWGGISWLTDKMPKPENDFATRKSLCFYWCNGNALPATAVPEVYEDIDKTNFMSLYATTEPWDDFADTLAYHLSFGKIGLRYKIDTRQGTVYDIGDKLRSPLFTAKFEFIRSFLNRKDIAYP